jgi:hypothetical protein
LLACSLKAISCCSPLGEAAAAAVEVENMEETKVFAEFECGFVENLAASDGERYAVNPNTEDDLDEGASDNVKLRTCYFGSSTITFSKIKEGYLSENEARAPGAETMPEPNGDKIIVYEDFFIAGLRMPAQPALADILLHFQA